MLKGNGHTFQKHARGRCNKSVESLTTQVGNSFNIAFKMPFLKAIPMAINNSKIKSKRGMICINNA